MRLGVELSEPWTHDAARAEQLGFELGWIDETTAPAPLVVAAALGPATTCLRVVACVDAGPHPVTLAEDAAVADLVLGGRLLLGLQSTDAELLCETVDLLQSALASRPLRHAGARWRVPAGLPEHTHAPNAVRVSPAPAQLELPVWLRGAAAPAVARSRGLAFVGDEDDHAAAQEAAWSETEETLGPAVKRLRRPALRSVILRDGRLDVEAMVARLIAERERWGLDVAILRLPELLDSGQRAAVLRAIATEVRPRVQLASLPDGLRAHWRDQAAPQILAETPPDAARARPSKAPGT